MTAPEEGFRLGWIVGFLEGEGTFRAGLSEGCVHLRIEAKQVQRETLDRLVQYSGAGHVRGPYARTGPNQSPIHEWTTAGVPARALMERLRGHLSPKRRAQVDAALAQYAVRRRRDPVATGLKAAATMRERRHTDSRQLRLVDKKQ